MPNDLKTKGRSIQDYQSQTVGDDRAAFHYLVDHTDHLVSAVVYAVGHVSIKIGTQI